MDISVRPDGSVSVTVIVPLVGGAVAALVTVTLYVAPCWPGVKVPVWEEATLSTGVSRYSALL